MKSEFLCEEDIEKIGYVSNVKEFKIDVNNNIDNLEICPNQMVILNIQNIQCETSSIFLKGHLVGDDREYSLGYIVDKKYTEVLSDCTEEFVSNEMDIKDGTEYSLYIINCSNKILTFSGNVFANLDDLIYHDYGNESLRVEENSNIIIDLSGLSNSRDIEGIYVYNCITRQTVKFQFSRLIEYESQQEGIYLVYAMTVQGEIIDLSKYVTIEYSINEGNGIIGLWLFIEAFFYNNKKTKGGTTYVQKIKSIAALVMAGVLILGQNSFAYAKEEVNNLTPYQERLILLNDELGTDYVLSPTGDTTYDEMVTFYTNMSLDEFEEYIRDAYVAEQAFDKVVAQETEMRKDDDAVGYSTLEK